ncbi:D-aminoacyl-tRNA deacylase 1 isoform X3 [Parasteatoda tepidariorum]|uniref:D-aminoacyl-tRNA deacylase 1 isoform X2 n=1 Tax=Parasteatoda tepidariorum TaxID=114398 RepID=UPI00077F9B27|nr:D-aminoacyl-tRNA deacylase 1 isoform X2 [Parasteatoda tepidariorum]XP_042906591.1 D-aminoacyl-tRNA deacylase 1 isoform X3 [Parasteatoda tepidariorum]
MRALIQRCMNASVSVDGETINSIGRGLCIFIGISRDDTRKDIDFMVRKLLNLRLFDNDENKRWSLSVLDKKYEVLLISQFTLHATLKGNKPDFHLSMDPENSQKFYSDFVAAMKHAYDDQHVKDGKFGAYMQVNIQNDGPVTMSIESNENKKINKETEQENKKSLENAVR